MSYRRQKTILLIHGVLGSQKTWRKLKTYLHGKGYHIIAFRLPLEISTGKPDPYRAARHIKRRLKYRKIYSPLILIGHSFGGLIAKAFLLEYGDEYDIPVLITLATPHKGVRWGRKTFSMLTEIFGGLRWEGIEELLPLSLYKISQTFSYNSRIIQNLNRAFELKSVRFLLIGAVKSKFRLVTPVGGGRWSGGTGFASTTGIYQQGKCGAFRIL